MQPGKRYPSSLPVRHIAPYVLGYGTMQEVADQMGLSDRAVRRTIAQDHVTFDWADRFFCAIGCPLVWHVDPKLNWWYRRVVKEADHIRPITRESFLENKKRKRERARERNRLYQAANPEKTKARRKRRYHENKEQEKERVRQWRAAQKAAMV